MVCSNKIAARMRDPSNAGLLITRVRIACTRLNISASELYRSCGMPYSPSALGVLPPLWSRAAKKPSPDAICSRCAMSTGDILAASRRVGPLAAACAHPPALRLARQVAMIIRAR
jgi:hypothetical protein